MVEDIFINQIIWALLISFSLSQFIKMILQKDFSLIAFFKPGGMPSSHTAPAVSLCLSIYLAEGVTTAFAIAIAFTVVIIRDSLGIRYEIGEQGKQINKLTTAVFKKNAKEVVMFNEVQGHKPLQVLAGGLVGIMVSIVLYYVW